MTSLNERDTEHAYNLLQRMLNTANEHLKHMRSKGLKPTILINQDGLLEHEVPF